MADSALGDLPLVLREEPFGGLLFIPRGAVHIELDQAGYAAVRDYLLGRLDEPSAEQCRLLAQVAAELKDLGPCRVVSHEYPAGLAYPFPVYSAPTLADFQITEQCTLGCPHCYASSSPAGGHVALGDIELTLQELRENGITQIALGGGEPLEHPDINVVLELCHSYNLVPNLTTNGLPLDRPGVLDALRRFTGAVALSLEGVGAEFSRRRKLSFAFFEGCLERLLQAGIATVLQVTLSRESFGQLGDIVRFCQSQRRLYGVIFLAYKEVGRGAHYHHVLAGLPPSRVYDELKQAMAALSSSMRAGYDCCLTPALVGLEQDFGFRQGDQLEGCSALRSSIGVLPNLDVTPCTFTPDTVIGNLRQQRLAALWRSPRADAFRRRMAQRLESDEACRQCDSRSQCLGGCPAFDLVGCRPAARLKATALQNGKQS